MLHTTDGGATKIAVRRGASVVKTIRLTGVSVNARHTYRYLVHLRYGLYTWVVTATDSPATCSVRPAPASYGS